MESKQNAVLLDGSYRQTDATRDPARSPFDLIRLFAGNQYRRLKIIVWYCSHESAPMRTRGRSKLLLRQLDMLSRFDPVFTNPPGVDLQNVSHRTRNRS